MVKKKRVILSWIPTDKNKMLLQNMGFLNKHGRSNGKNLNEFLNRAVHDKIGIDNSGQNGELLEKLIKSEIEAVQRAHAERNKEHEKRLRELAQKLHEAQSQKKVIDYEGQND